MTIIPTPDSGREAALRHLDDAAAEYERKVVSDRTRYLYARDWASFVAWCRAAGLSPLPAEVETVRRYLSDLARRVDEDGEFTVAPASMGRAVAAISRAHQESGHQSPTQHPRARAVLVGIRRTRQHRTRRMRALLLDDVRAVLALIEPATLIGMRDTFAIMAGFAGAFRRSELAAVVNGDVTWHPADGLYVRLWTSKTDQEGQGRTVSLPRVKPPQECPVCLWRRWVDATAGTMPSPRRTWRHVCQDPPPELDPAEPLVRSVRRGDHLGGAVTGDALHAMVKRRAADAGYTTRVGFHSLRAGFVTQAKRNGADTDWIMKQTGHTSRMMVKVYEREHAPLVNNAVTLLWR